MQRSREKKNRMGKTRDLFEKIRHTTVTFHAKMGSIKDKSVTEERKAICERFLYSKINKVLSVTLKKIKKESKPSLAINAKK